MQVEFSPMVKWLLMNQSEDKVRIKYMKHSWLLPVISERPPYYTNPRYEPYYPLL
ncbi:hypothetical protein ACFYKT_00775 [Cytobacillus sp. FJAT-53684]|uniref:Uncharacterized protein n=1 Tax=Cytobacillus mangrovibacter TaxID=3299024 RepID=A0ABW6JSQ9_9BACI